MSYWDLEKTLLGYMDNVKAQLLSRPLNLGGTTASGGGGGGPVNGFIGYLPQTRVAYDLSELATNDLPVSGESLLDNLNRIRYRINALENSVPSGVSGGLEIQENGSVIDSSATILDFGEGILAQVSGNKVLISVSGVTSSGNASTIYPERASMFHFDSRVTVGSGLGSNRGSSNTALFGVNTFQNPSANGDTFTQSFILKGGTYTFRVLGETNTFSAMVDWYIDDVKVISQQDWYNSTFVANVTKSVDNVTVSGDGRHVLKGAVNGKHASSSQYSLGFTRYWFVPASDTEDN